MASRRLRSDLGVSILRRPGSRRASEQDTGHWGRRARSAKMPSRRSAKASASARRAIRTNASTSRIRSRLPRCSTGRRRSMNRLHRRRRALQAVDQLTDEDWTFSLANKLLGQVNVVRYGLKSVRPGGASRSRPVWRRNIPLPQRDHPQPSILPSSFALAVGREPRFRSGQRRFPGGSMNWAIGLFGGGIPAAGSAKIIVSNFGGRDGFGRRGEFELGLLHHCGAPRAASASETAR